jgi:hypothetical protein
VVERAEFGCALEITDRFREAVQVIERRAEVGIGLLGGLELQRASIGLQRAVEVALQ